MDEPTKTFVEAMVPILERESNMAFGPKSVCRIVRWTCKESGSLIVSEAFLDKLKTMSTNYAVLLRVLNGLLAGGLGATALEIGYLSVKAMEVSMPLQRLLDMIEPNKEAQ